jgi:hypothetical protein
MLSFRAGFLSHPFSGSSGRPAKSRRDDLIPSACDKPSCSDDRTSEQNGGIESVGVRPADPKKEKETIMKKWMQTMLMLSAVTMWAHAAAAAEAAPSSGALEKDNAPLTGNIQAKIQVNLALKSDAESTPGHYGLTIVRDDNTGYCTVNIRVFNYGDRDLFEPAYLALYLDPVASPTCGDTGAARRLPLGIIRARSSRWYTFTNVYLPGSTPTLYGFVDSSCVINESSERDNVRAWAFMFMPVD